MRFNGSQIFYPVIAILVLGFTPVVCAQEFIKPTNNEEARGLLKRLENYEDKYLAPQEQVKKQEPKQDSSKVMVKQQEVLVSEVLRLRSQVAQLESQISQGQEEADFSDQEQKLITEMTKERKRADDLEKELAEEKSKDFNRLNRQLEDTKSAIVSERNLTAKKEKLLKEASEKIASLEQKLQAQQELQKMLTKVRNESEQLELQIESQKGLETDNLYLKKSLAEEKQKSADLIKKSKELILRLSTSEEENKQKKIALNNEQALKIKEAQKEIANLKLANEASELEKTKLETALANYKKDIAERQDKEKVLKDSLKLTTENVKKSSASNEEYSKQIATLEKQILALEQQSLEAKAQIESLTTSTAELSGLKAEHAVLQANTSQCQEQLKADEEELARLKSVEAEMIAAKNELMLKNSASEFLAVGPSRRQRDIRAKASQSVREQSMDNETQKKYNDAKLAFEKAQKLLDGGGNNTVSNTGEAQVLTVVGSKVNLRNGPGMEHSPVMQISEGSKLTMEVKEGEWYRVYTPTGSRAYIHQDEVSSDSQDPISMIEQANVRGPAKAPLRGGESELVPFGKVKVAGALDTEDLAIKKLKSQMGKNE